MPPFGTASLNYDVVANVFKMIEHIPPSRESKQVLFRAALTCKAFQDPALDALWRSMDTIVPLLRLLPTIQQVDGIYTIYGDIDDQDMMRFNLYARRIRTLTLDRNSRDKQVAPFIFTALPLLPALQHLICPFHDRLNAPNTPLVLCSTLQRVDLLGDTSNSYPRDLNNELLNIIPFMYVLHKKAPGIRHLALYSQTDPRLWQVILRFRSLRSLQLSGELDVVTFKNIASLPELQYLNMTMIGTLSLPISSLPVENNISITFPKLRSLQITGEGSTISSYLVLMRGGRLVDISITMKPDSSTYARFPVNGLWETCLSVMEAQWSSTLRSIRLVAFEEGFIQTSARFFASLSKIHLENLVIAGQMAMDKCPTLASSIPHVKELCISRVTHCQKEEHWDVLMAFARFCPQLTSLSVKLDMPFSPSPLQRKYSHRLRTLCIASDDLLDVRNLTHATDVAQYLESMFPILAVIQSTQNSASWAFWEHVNGLVHKFQAVRQDERKKHVTPVQDGLVTSYNMKGNNGRKKC
ncbi:hypothetical protein H2248_004203 [Termitomyces sp. 'cryptogamus']|nr:hypothetical protein H2248_004203 [Termitomyces sp. 'cryptogamus']